MRNLKRLDLKLAKEIEALFHNGSLGNISHAILAEYPTSTKGTSFRLAFETILWNSKKVLHRGEVAWLGTARDGSAVESEAVNLYKKGTISLAKLKKILKRTHSKPGKTSVIFSGTPTAVTTPCPRCKGFGGKIEFLEAKERRHARKFARAIRRSELTGSLPNARKKAGKRRSVGR